MVETTGKEFQFLIVTRSHDLGSREPYAGVTLGRWHQLGNANVRYLRKGLGAWRELLEILRSTDFDIVLLNSVFSTLASAYLLLRRLGLVRRTPVIIAPRGELSHQALSLKHVRKRLFLGLARACRMYKDVVWSASSHFEEADVRAAIGKTSESQVDVRIVPDIARPISPVVPVSPEKSAGCARIVFLSRIDRKKNLHVALRILGKLKGEIQFDIYGPCADLKYLSECREIADESPENLEVRFFGELPPDRVSEVLSEHHLFFLPTLNENFGHVIIEAMGAGCPVLISDQTAWRALEPERAGWDIPLNDESRFVGVLSAVVDMTASDMEPWRRGAWEYAHRALATGSAVAAQRALFRQVKSA